MSIDAMKQALEALETVRHQNMSPQIHPAKVALRAAITEAERQEPVAKWDETRGVADRLGLAKIADETLLYTTPQPAIPAGLVLVKVENLIACRDALVDKDRDEAYHQLYTSCDWIDPYKPWAEWEAMLAAASKLENLR